MDRIEIVINSPDDLVDAATRLLSFAGSSRIFLFNGEMGSGKTTFIKALCRQLGSSDHFSSPTFSLVNEYQSPAGKIYHLDLYRIRQPEELLDIGIEEILDSGCYCFIEWPSLAAGFIETQYLTVNIDVVDGLRVIKAR